jgi:hypothetical protein
MAFVLSGYINNFSNMIFLEWINHIAIFTVMMSLQLLEMKEGSVEFSRKIKYIGKCKFSLLIGNSYKKEQLQWLMDVLFLSRFTSLQSIISGHKFS